MGSPQPIAVLFVCLGNHCRSPAAHAVASEHAERRGIDFVTFDSAGTGGAHVGDLPHLSTQGEGRRRGYQVDHRGRRIHPDDFAWFDLIIAMDELNIEDLGRLRGDTDQRTSVHVHAEPEQIHLLRRWDPYAMPGDENLADPWGKAENAYKEMYDQIERCIPPLLDHLIGMANGITS